MLWQQLHRCLSSSLLPRIFLGKPGLLLSMDEGGDGSCVAMASVHTSHLKGERQKRGEEEEEEMVEVPQLEESNPFIKEKKKPLSAIKRDCLVWRASTAASLAGQLRGPTPFVYIPHSASSRLLAFHLAHGDGGPHARLCLPSNGADEPSVHCLSPPTRPPHPASRLSLLLSYQHHLGEVVPSAPPRPFRNPKLARPPEAVRLWGGVGWRESRLCWLLLVVAEGGKGFFSSFFFCSNAMLRAADFLDTHQRLGIKLSSRARAAWCHPLRSMRVARAARRPCVVCLVQPTGDASRDVSHIIQTRSPKRGGCNCPISPLHFQTGRYVMRWAGLGLIGRRGAEARSRLVRAREWAGPFLAVEAQ